MKNNVSINGNVGKDAEVLYLENGNHKISFSVATDDGYYDNNKEWISKVNWHNIIAWGKLAKTYKLAIKKGMEVIIDGKLTYRKYENKEGQTVHITEVEARSIKIVAKVVSELGEPVKVER